MGDPLTGKSTYVKQHAKQGDIIIDLDEIARALTVTKMSHQYGLHIRQLAIIARQSVINKILSTNYRDVDIWLIHADPSPKQLQQYQMRGAKFYKCQASRAELAERLQTRAPENQAKIKQYYANKATKAYAEDY